MRTARDSFLAIGDRWSLSTVSVDLPLPVYQQGRYDEAWSLVTEIDEVPAPADREWQIKRRCLHARLLARERRLAEAEDLARQAVAIATDTDQLWFRADALMDLVEVLRLAGSPHKAAKSPTSSSLRRWARNAGGRA
jgi:hypothetical protein